MNNEVASPTCFPVERYLLIASCALLGLTSSARSEPLSGPMAFKFARLMEGLPNGSRIVAIHSIAAIKPPKDDPDWALAEVKTVAEAQTINDNYEKRLWSIYQMIELGRSIFDYPGLLSLNVVIHRDGKTGYEINIAHKFDLWIDSRGIITKKNLG